MMLYRFEALGLLPDKEIYNGYVPVEEKAFRKMNWTLEQIFDLLPGDAQGFLLCKIKNKRYGTLVRVQTIQGRRIYLKVDAKKFKKFDKELGGLKCLG